MSSQFTIFLGIFYFFEDVATFVIRNDVQDFHFKIRHQYTSALSAGFGKLTAAKGAKLLPDPLPNSIGNFFEEETEEKRFIQCYMLSLAEINGEQYGVGFPIDMPVMLTYFEGNELLPVQPDYKDYDHLVNHVSVQLEDSNFQLYQTPVVLTLQGEFEDEDMNDVIPRYDDEGDGDEPREEISIEEVIAIEGLDAEDTEDDDEDDDDEDDDDEDDDDDLEDDDYEDDDSDKGADNADSDNNSNMRSFLNSAAAGKPAAGSVPRSDVSEITIIRGAGVPSTRNFAPESIVTDEDAKALKKSHRRADKIISYASDMSLIASFHYKKNNFHLVRLTEPLFITGKRMQGIKGYYFSLLNDFDSAKITPTIEKLLLSRPKRRVAAMEDEEREGAVAFSRGGEVEPRRRGVREDRAATATQLMPPGTPGVSAESRPPPPAKRSSRRSWRNKIAPSGGDIETDN